MNDTGMIKIYYWPDGSWCYDDHFSDVEDPSSYSWFTVRDNSTAEQIQEDIQLLLRNRQCKNT